MDCLPDHLNTDVDLEAKVGFRWPTRDQRYRNTCIAFSATAAMELFFALRGRQVGQLSPDFLYNRMRKGLSQGYLERLAREVPGYRYGATRLSQALCVIRDYGCCDEELRPYQPANTMSDQTGPDITAEQQQAADANRHAHFIYGLRLPSDVSENELVCGHEGRNFPISRWFQVLLQRDIPVAVGIQVFQASGGYDNWSIYDAVSTGYVAYPGDARFPGVSGETFDDTAGHSVLLTGYVVDPADPQRGWFLFRNSWGVDFNPYGEAPAIEPLRGKLRPGCGALSSEAVDAYVWEYLALSESGNAYSGLCSEGRD